MFDIKLCIKHLMCLGENSFPSLTFFVQKSLLTRHEVLKHIFQYHLEGYLDLLPADERIDKIYPVLMFEIFIVRFDFVVELFHAVDLLSFRSLWVDLHLVAFGGKVLQLLCLLISLILGSWIIVLSGTQQSSVTALLLFSRFALPRPL